MFRQDESSEREGKFEWGKEEEQQDVHVDASDYPRPYKVQSEFVRGRSLAG
jgi:hypothetical protein